MSNIPPDDREHIRQLWRKYVREAALREVTSHDQRMKHLGWHVHSDASMRGETPPVEKTLQRFAKGDNIRDDTIAKLGRLLHVYFGTVRVPEFSDECVHTIISNAWHYFHYTRRRGDSDASPIPCWKYHLLQFEIAAGDHRIVATTTSHSERKDRAYEIIKIVIQGNDKRIMLYGEHVESSSIPRRRQQDPPRHPGERIFPCVNLQADTDPEEQIFAGVAVFDDWIKKPVVSMCLLMREQAASYNDVELPEPENSGRSLKSTQHKKLQDKWKEKIAEQCALLLPYSN